MTTLRWGRCRPPLSLVWQSRNVWQTWPIAAARRSGIDRSKSLGSATRSAASTRALRSGSRLPCRSPRPSRVRGLEHLALPLGRLGPGSSASASWRHRSINTAVPDASSHSKCTNIDGQCSTNRSRCLPRHPSEDHVQLPSADPTIQHRRDQLRQAVDLPGPARQARRLGRVQVGLGPQPRLQGPMPVDLVEPRCLIGAQGREDASGPPPHAAGTDPPTAARSSGTQTPWTAVVSGPSSTRLKCSVHLFDHARGNPKRSGRSPRPRSRSEPKFGRWNTRRRRSAASVERRELEHAERSRRRVRGSDVLAGHGSRVLRVTSAHASTGQGGRSSA